MSTNDDFYDALVRWTDERANRWLLASSSDNIESSISIDKDTGEVIIDKTSSISNPDITGTNYELANGGAYYQAKQFKKAFDDLNANVAANWLEATMSKSLAFFFDVIELGTFGMIQYKADNPQVTINIAELAEQIYCAGSFQHGLFEYASQNHNEDDFGWIVDLANEIPNSTLKDWYTNGQSQPRDDYLSYGCYLVPQFSGEVDISILDDASAPYWVMIADSLNLKPAGNRWKIDLSGHWTHSDGRICDAFYYQVNSGDELTSLQTTFATRTTSYSAQDYDPVNYPDYNASHVYTVFFEENFETFVRGIKFAVKPPNSTGWTGTITMTVTDLGEA